MTIRKTIETICRGGQIRTVFSFVIYSKSGAQQGKFGQYPAEVLMVAVIAFGCSYLTSSVFTGQLANALLQQNIPASEEKAAGVKITPKDGYGGDVVVRMSDDSVLSDMTSGQDAACKWKFRTGQRQIRSRSVLRLSFTTCCSFTL